MTTEPKTNMTMSADDFMAEREALHRELERLSKELRHVKSDNEMLKDTIVRLAMKISGVTE